MKEVKINLIFSFNKNFKRYAIKKIDCKFDNSDIRETEHSFFSIFEEAKNSKKLDNQFLIKTYNYIWGENRLFFYLISEFCEVSNLKSYIYFAFGYKH